MGTSKRQQLRMPQMMVSNDRKLWAAAGVFQAELRHPVIPVIVSIGGKSRTALVVLQAGETLRAEWYPRTRELVDKATRELLIAWVPACLLLQSIAKPKRVCTSTGRDPRPAPAARPTRTAAAAAVASPSQSAPRSKTPRPRSAP